MHLNRNAKKPAPASPFPNSPVLLLVPPEKALRPFPLLKVSIQSQCFTVTHSLTGKALIDGRSFPRMGAENNSSFAIK